MIGLFFDTETTGFKTSVYTPSIVQIGAILQNCDSRRVLGEINLILHVNELVPAEAAAIHGIDDAMIAAYGMNSSLAEMLFTDFVRRADRLVAHNIRFDVGIIKDYWPHAYAAMEPKEQYCTMLRLTPFDIPKAHAGKSRWPKLTDAYRYFVGEELVGAHDAMADVRGCRDVYFGIEERIPRCTACSGLLTLAGGHEVMPADRHSPVPNTETEQG